MLRFLTGLALFTSMVLAPVSGAFASVCECVHPDGAASSLGPVPCCPSEMQQCCYEHTSSDDGELQLVAEVNPQNRAEFKALPSKLLHQLRLTAVRAVSMPRPTLSTGPPLGQRRRLSLRQTWLI